MAPWSARTSVADPTTPFSVREVSAVAGIRAENAEATRCGVVIAALKAKAEA